MIQQSIKQIINMRCNSMFSFNAMSLTQLDSLEELSLFHAFWISQQSEGSDFVCGPNLDGRFFDEFHKLQNIPFLILI